MTRCARATPSLLLVGYGNTSRRDDGVAAFILQGLLSRLGLDPRAMQGDDELEPGPGIKALFVHQLAPELAELAAQYDTVVFVDAHVNSAGWEPLSWQPVLPAVEAGMIGHHLKPGVIVALAETLYGRRPEAFLLSVQGHNFDFGESLSAETTSLAEQGIALLERLVAARQTGTSPTG